MWKSTGWASFQSLFKLVICGLLFGCCSCGMVSTILLFLWCLDFTIPSPRIIIGWHNVPIVVSYKEALSENDRMGLNGRGCCADLGRGVLCWVVYVCPAQPGCLSKYFASSFFGSPLNFYPRSPVVCISFGFLASFPLGVRGTIWELPTAEAEEDAERDLYLEWER